MRWIINLIITAIFIFNIQATCAKPTSITIQRYAWLGSNTNGTRVAYTQSHFGPSSHAPFVHLVIKEANKEEPLLLDIASKLTGNERDLAELRAYLINKNLDNLKNFGIEISPDSISETNMAISPNNDKNAISGFIDIENDEISEFTVKSHRSDSCQNTIEIWLNGMIRLTSNSNQNFCVADGFLLRNVYRTKNALWLVMTYHLYALNSLDTYWIDIQGITMR